ncbi:citron rho-interacting kinase-like [Tubulanus polymorphus]|uniref:citron rho-interacting kinase-like n=1 Tax=Tubulanus polymorphus TaxID=672921 RepID=UPI003DA64356
MEEVFVENSSIAVRTAKLNHIFLGKSSKIAHRAIVSREGLLDSLLVLYQECHNENLMKNKHIAQFVKKYEPTIREIQKLRISIDDFDVKKIIGRGHFGEVKVVRERHTGDVYALKILRKSETLTQQHVTFYEEERDIMAKANSPWITQLQYAFQDHDHLYLVMDFHIGGDLLSLLTRYDDILEESMARFYVAEIVLAIRALHMMGYVHRDIKPENILIDRTGHVKLADFGSAATLEEGGCVHSKMPVGTPDYISPELLTAMNSTSSDAYGVEVDWWSLGIMTYEMLYGTAPFTDDEGSMVATYSNIMKYKKCLVFPKKESVRVSNEAQSFIKGLLTGKYERMDYEAICKHQFFSEINFATIRHETPPFIPTVTSQYDTSNFDEFEVQKPEVRLDMLSNNREFSGRDLPFIGFTFTKMLMSNRPSESRSSLLLSETCSPKAKNNLERKLTCRTNELQSIREKYHHLENKETTMKSDFENVKRRLNEKENKLASVTAERDDLEKDVVNYMTEISSLKRNLELEKKARADMDRDAEKLLKDIEEQAEIAEKLREDLKRTEMNQYKVTIAALENELDIQRKKVARLGTENRQNETSHSVLGSKVTELQQLLNKEQEKCRRACGEIEEQMNKQLEDFDQRELEFKHKINQMIGDKASLEEKLNEANSKLEKLEDELLNLSQTEKNDGSLHKKLQDSEAKRRSLETQLIELKKIEGIETRVADKMHAQSKKINQLVDKMVLMEEELRRKDMALRKQERVFNQKELQLQEKLRDLEIKSLSKKKDTSELENQLTILRQDKDKKAKKICDLESKVSDLECTNKVNEKRITSLQDAVATQQSNDNAVQESRKLEEELSMIKQEKLIVESRLTRLQEVLTKTKDELEENKAKISELESSHSKMECAHEEVVSQLKDNLNKANLTLSEMTASTADIDQRENEYRKKITLLESELATSSRQIEIKLSHLEQEKREIEIKYDSLSASSAINVRIESDLRKYQDQCTKLKSDLKMQTAEATRNGEEAKTLQGNMKLLQSQLQQKQRKCELLEEKLRELQRFKIDNESQVTELQCKNKQYEEKEGFWNTNKHTYEKAVEELEGQIDVLHRKYTSERQAREGAENQLKSLTIQRDNLQSRFDNTKQQLTEQATLAQSLNSQLDEVDKARSMLELNMKSAERSLDCYADENVALQDEISKLTNQVKNLKASNFALSQNLEEAMDKYDNLNTDKLELENYVEGLQVNHDHEKFKYDSTINQQSKLIDFLQAKTENTKKKKNIFGTPAKPSKSAAQAMTSGRPVQWRDMQLQLEAERTKNAELQHQNIKLKTELHQAKSATIQLKGRICQQCDQTKAATISGTSRSNSGTVTLAPPSQAVVSALVMSPSKQYACSPRTLLAPSRKRHASTPCVTTRPNKERMHHNIPHRFATGLNMRGTKCAVCLGTVHFVKQAAKCQECQMVCHPKCVSSLPATCGLPTQYVQHFSDVIMKKKSTPSKALSTADLNSMEMCGWMKVPRSGKQSMGGWEKHWVLLQEDRLCFFDKDNTESSPSDTFNLSPVDGEILINSAVTAAELRNTASSDLPYILKLESRPHSLAWPGRTLYLMAMSFPEKQKWVAVLEAMLSQNQKDARAHARILGRNVLSLTDTKRLDINCTLVLTEEILLIGADDGLFAHRLSPDSSDTPISIEGLTHVYHISTVEQLRIVVLIAGEERLVFTLEMKTLLSRIEQGFIMQPVSVLPKPVENVSGCTLAECKVFEDDITYLCLATPMKVCILKYNTGLSSFCIRKELPTIEPCSCILFTTNGLLISAEKLYRIDFSDYSMREFLDKRDSSLAYAVFGAATFDSFPIAVYQVSEEPEEYLICFHEFGVFVDGHGRRSRGDDMKWNGLPVSFVYRKPYLFVVLFNSLQVIDVLSCTGDWRSCQASLDLPSPHYLGPAFVDGAVYVASSHDNVLDVMCLKGNIKDQCENEKENSQPMSQNIPGSSTRKKGAKQPHSSQSGYTDSLGPTVILQYTPESKKLKVSSDV